MRSPAFILLAVLAILLAACGQKTCHVIGTIEGGQDGDSLFLITDMENGIPMDTLYVKNGQFEYQTEADSIRLCFLQYKQGGEAVQPFFLEPGTIHIDLKKDVSECCINGTQLNEEWQKLNKAAFDYQKEMMKLTKEAQKDTSEQNMQVVWAKVQTAQAKLSDLYYKTAEKNISNELGFVLVSNPIALSEEEVLKLINQMPPRFHSRKEIMEIENYLKSDTTGLSDYPEDIIEE